VTKIEKTGIHFKTDVFTAVAVVDAKAPYCFFLGGAAAVTILISQLGSVYNMVSEVG